MKLVELFKLSVLNQKALHACMLTALYIPVGVGIGLENIGGKNLRFVVAIAPPIDVETCPVCGIKIKNP